MSTLLLTDYWSKDKVSFEYEGTRKNGVAKGDKIYNLCMTGLLKEGFNGNH